MSLFSSETFFDTLREFSFRGKVRLVMPICPKNGRKRARIFGYTIDLDLSNHVDQLVYLGCYESLNSLRFKRILKPGMTVVDAGANIGYFSLLAASLVGKEGRVISIEPCPENYAVLEKAVSDNGLSHVSVFRYGLGDQTEERKVFFSPQKDIKNRTATMMHSDVETSHSVQVKRLDDCMDAWGIKSIDLLKIDVDGFETKIIQGAKALLERGLIHNIIVEFNDYWLKASGSSPELLAKLIESAGLVDRSDRYSLMAWLVGSSEDRHFAKP